MKTRRELELPFPEQLSLHLERYLAHHRPRLCERAQLRDGCARPSCARLWLSKTGVALTVTAIYDHIVRLTRAKFGQPVHPHLFRDCAATSIATRDPEHVRITMSVLGHARMATSERTYNHATSLEAMRQYQGRILALRRQP